RQFNHDFYSSLFVDGPRVIIADTDGLHRIIGGHELAPYGRDFDANCRYWAHVAFVHGGQFNTKETLHYYENPDEVDCIYVSLGDAQFCYYKYGQRILQPLSCANCDDFIWESIDYGYGNRFTGFDTGVAAAMNDLPLTRRPFTRMAGYGPVPVRIGADMTLYVTQGNVYGNPTGAEIATHLAYVIQPMDGYTAEIPWQNLVYIDTIPATGGNLLAYSLPVTEEWRPYCPMLFSLITTAPPGHFSDPWPFLVCHEDDIVPETTSFTGGQSADTNTSHWSGPLTVPVSLRQRWNHAIRQDAVRKQEKTKATEVVQPQICMAGWNYSTLVNSFTTGLLQIAVVVYAPKSSKDSQGIDTTPELSLRLMDSTGNSPWIRISNIENWSISTEPDGTYYSTCLYYDLHEEDPMKYFQSGVYLINIKAHVAGVESGVWPYLDIE
ncbi:hypothetical protein K8T06_18240, partial [bacterium]|nr:hypothetical protein [bacterium]